MKKIIFLLFLFCSIVHGAGFTQNCQAIQKINFGETFQKVIGNQCVVFPNQYPAIQISMKGHQELSLYQGSQVVKEYDKNFSQSNSDYFFTGLKEGLEYTIVVASSKDEVLLSLEKWYFNSQPQRISKIEKQKVSKNHNLKVIQSHNLKTK